MPQNDALSQNAMIATIHSCHGTSSLTRRMSLVSTNVLEDLGLVFVDSLVTCQLRLEGGLAAKTYTLQHVMFGVSVALRFPPLRTMIDDVGIFPKDYKKNERPG
jgi:hypothetical protein